MEAKDEVSITQFVTEITVVLKLLQKHCIINIIVSEQLVCCITRLVIICTCISFY